MVVQPTLPVQTSAIARPVRKAPPTTFQDVRMFPEIIPVQEVIIEEITEDESSAAPSEGKGSIPGKPCLLPHSLDTLKCKGFIQG